MVTIELSQARRSLQGHVDRGPRALGVNVGVAALGRSYIGVAALGRSYIRVAAWGRSYLLSGRVHADAAFEI